jgi:serine/threonine protein kinase
MAYISQKKESDDDIISNASSNSLYMEHVPFNIRGRAEWWELKHSEILLYEKLAEGGNGIINKASWRGLKCVVKCLKHNNNDIEYQDMINEISVISHLRHPNLVLFLGACTITDPLLLLYEFMPHGSLDNYYANISNQKNRLWKPKKMQAYKWIYELTQAVYFLHHCYYPIMHRDLKPSNILLNEDLHIKLTDFGLSRTIKKKHEKYKMSGCTGTLRYMAPEVIFNEGEDYDLKIDIYSLALVFWFILTGKIPYAELDLNPHVIQLIQIDYRPDIKDVEIIEIQDLIKQMWSTNPDNRPDIDHILKMIEDIKIVEKQNKCSLS